MIIRYGKPIALYRHKLSGPQINYTVTEKELIGIVKTLKEFLTILLGKQFNIYADHRNITHQDFNTG